jgi:transcriptional regulator with PAS, ATPase and Fis domain
MHRLFENIKKAARTDVSIYISGETGVGKELVARAIHNESNRAKQPFVAVNVANFSNDLIESQLFGHKKGAFTGAITSSPGLMRVAANGTLFLDEVTSLPTHTQAKLLRVLQERQYYPVGDVHLQEFSASIVSASNMSFEEAIALHHFREDLRYRLEVIPLEVPPLRERRDDIILLFNYFLKLASGDKKWKIDRQLAKKLKQYPWPGNVRELENCARFSAAMADKDRLNIDDLPENVKKIFYSNTPVKRKKITRNIITKALYKNNNSRNKTAEFLAISRMTLWRKMKTFNLL